MGGNPQTQGKLTGWLCLAAGSYMAAAFLSGAASMFGLTDFPNDNRGEWALITVPAMLLLSLALATFGGRRLVRRRTYHAWQIALAAAAITVSSFFWLSWRFAHAAA